MRFSKIFLGTRYFGFLSYKCSYKIPKYYKYTGTTYSIEEW